MIQRFSNAKSASDWSSAGVRQELMRALKALTLSDGIHETATEEAHINGVTELFITEVNAEKEEVYRKWSAKIHQVEAHFPGFRGVYVQSPRKGKGEHWITLLQFDSIENLDRWLESSERKALLKESSPWIY